MTTFLFETLYDKVRAWLVGGTAAAGIAGAVLWGISQVLDGQIPGWVTALVTAGAAQLVGLAAAYFKTETKTPTPAEPAVVVQAPPA